MSERCVKEGHAWVGTGDERLVCDDCGVDFDEMHLKKDGPIQKSEWEEMTARLYQAWWLVHRWHMQGGIRPDDDYPKVLKQDTADFLEAVPEPARPRKT